ncbi:Uncharacterized protein ChrSV_2076 [Chromobacterium vaccinii]|nr:Uncharacterized protein ChrSW_2076 [Chromobacterium vaccinii]QND89534.1 Uncharacterized protein ChrSV_2076 [Chromobacterium vaccinii]
MAVAGLLRPSRRRQAASETGKAIGLARFCIGSFSQARQLEQALDETDGLSQRQTEQALTVKQN